MNQYRDLFLGTDVLVPVANEDGQNKKLEKPIMSKGKRRLKKKKKAILKKLEESVELENARKMAEAIRSDPTTLAPINSTRSTLAHKNRPDKKRGG